MQQARVVLHLQLRHRRDPVDAPVHKEYYYHLGWAHGTTWSFGCLPLSPSKDGFWMALGLRFNFVSLRACARPPTTVQTDLRTDPWAGLGATNSAHAFRDLNFKYRIRLSVFAIIVDEIPIPELLPCNVAVRRVPEIPEVEIWPGHEEFVAKKGSRSRLNDFVAQVVPRPDSDAAGQDNPGGVMLPDDHAALVGDPNVPDEPSVYAELDQMEAFADAQGLIVDQVEDVHHDNVPDEIGVQASNWLHSDEEEWISTDLGGRNGISTDHGGRGAQAAGSSSGGWHFSAEPRMTHDEFPVPGLPGAVFKYDRKLHRLAAHYRWTDSSDGLVRVGRVLIGSSSTSERRRYQGRPIGFMLAWMFAPSHPEYAPAITDQVQHRALAEYEQRDHPALSYKVRCGLRNWAARQPSLQPLFQLCLEEGGLPSPGAEPLGLSY